MNQSNGTPAQKSRAFQKHSTRTTQESKILELLRQGREIALPELLKLGVAQYNARILGLRRQGWKIRNRTKMIGGVRHSWYRLETPEPAPSRPPTANPTPGPIESPQAQLADFRDRSVPRWRDPEQQGERR